MLLAFTEWMHTKQLKSFSIRNTYILYVSFHVHLLVCFVCVWVCMCVLLCACVPFSRFSFLGRANGLVMLLAVSSGWAEASRAKGSSSLCFFCLWSAPLSAERGDMSCHSLLLCSREAHKHLKDLRVTQQDVHTRCTFVSTDTTFTHEAIQGHTQAGRCVRVCARISPQRQTHAHANRTRDRVEQCWR